jgi:hypothetical protein
MVAWQLSVKNANANAAQHLLLFGFVQQKHTVK